MQSTIPITLVRRATLTAAACLLMPAAWAAPSVAENFDTCRAEAEMLYGTTDRLPRVRLDDIRRSGRELRLRIVTPEGESFDATCEVNRRSGKLLSLEPHQPPSDERRLSSVQR